MSERAQRLADAARLPLLAGRSSGNADPHCVGAVTPTPLVSTPVAWAEVAQAVAEKDASKLVFDANAVLERIATLGDLFFAQLSLQQTISG